MTPKENRRPGFIPGAVLQLLLDQLLAAGYDCLGPVEKDGAIQFQSIHGLDQLPRGVRNDQEPGRYRLRHTDDQKLFAWNHGPQGLKPLCFAAQEVLWEETRDGDGQRVEQRLPATRPTAVFGVRACDIAALAIQDQHFMREDAADPHYKARREQLLLIGVDCAQSAKTCFCVSTGDGPALDGGFDIGLAEIDEGFLIWPASERGKPWLESLKMEPATDRQLEAMLNATTSAAAEQQRRMPNEKKLSRLYERLGHSRWQDVAQRCLSCGNCTLVCPTCFCYSTEHQTAVTGDSALMVRSWDSCFSPTHSEMGKFQVRSGIDQRYRQWATHKLAGWQQQYGRSGCVGCGRCISWCPVGIDLTEEVQVILNEGSRDV